MLCQLNLNNAGAYSNMNLPYFKIEIHSQLERLTQIQRSLKRSMYFKVPLLQQCSTRRHSYLALSSRATSLLGILAHRQQKNRYGLIFAIYVLFATMLHCYIATNLEKSAFRKKNNLLLHCYFATINREGWYLQDLMRIRLL